MALLLDGPPSKIEDLSAWDSDLQNVAVAEGIDITLKLQLAAAAVERAVETMLLSDRPSYGLMRLGLPTLRHIAVTPELKLWHTYLTLRLVYQDLYYSRLNDRYKAKMDLYNAQEAQALGDLRITGLGIVQDPIPQALPPQVSPVKSSDAGGTIYVSVTLLNDRGEEGMMSVPIEADTQDGQAANINIIALADNAVGWNLYAGLSPNTLLLQNSQMLDPLTSATLAAGRLKTGRKPGDGQKANRMHPVPARILRG